MFEEREDGVFKPPPTELLGRALKGLRSPMPPLDAPVWSWSIDVNEGLKELEEGAPPPYILVAGGFMAEEVDDRAEEVDMGGLKLPIVPWNILPPIPGFSLSCLFNHVIICALLSKFF